MRSASWWLLLFCLARAQAADSYRLDAVNSRISFNIQYFGMLWVSARFPEFSGEFVLDRQGAASRVDVNVQMASVDCLDPRWNARLRSADWLDVQRYPQMTFHSDRVEFDADGPARATGELTLHGVTRTVRLEIGRLSCSDAGASSERCGFVADAHIKRSDYGFAHGFWIGGDQVDIDISGIGVRSEPSRTDAVNRSTADAPTRSSSDRR
jgi:polyisoprenoid-binding protein YceI